MEMTGKYENFDHQEEEEHFDDARETQETSFTDEIDREEENLLYDANKDLVKNPENFTRADKRIFLKKYFNYKVYGDAESRQFLDRLEMKKGSDKQVDVFFNGERIGDVDLETGKGTLNKSPGLHVFENAFEKIKTYRTTTLKGQIEENTGDDDEAFNGVIEDNIKKRFQSKINEIDKKSLDKRKPGEDIELQQLKEDLGRIQTGKKLQTDAGKQILVDEVGFARRALELKKIVRRIPILSGIMVPIVAVLTLVILAARGAFYSASNAVASSKKKTSGKKGDDSFDPIEEVQNTVSQVLKQFGENIEITTAVAIGAYLVFRKNR